MEQFINEVFEQKSIYIDSIGAFIDELKELNKLISYDDEIRLILVCDYNVLPAKGKVNNLEVLDYLNQVTKLVIFNHSSKVLSNIDKVKNLKVLSEFELGGFLNHKIDLSFLSKFNLNILNLELEANAQIYNLICNNLELKVLRINSLNLSKINENNIIEIEIKKSLLNEKLMEYKMPYIQSIHLSNIRRITDFSFLSSFKNLHNISLRNTQITSFPFLEVDVLERIELIKNTKLIDISSIIKLDVLKKLFISQCEKIPLKMLEACTTINGLKQFYLLTSKKHDKLIMEELLKKLNINRDSNRFWEE